MTDDAVTAYLDELRRELRRRGAMSERFVSEAHDHLIDAIESGTRGGLSREDAEQAAFDRFGSARTVAGEFAIDHFRRLHRWLLVAAGVLGFAIAYVDSQPTWDDTGVTAFALLLAAGVLGLIGPQRPWRWALMIGFWIPVHLILNTPTLGTVAGGFAILLFPMAGAYAGMLVRRTLRPSP